MNLKDWLAKEERNRAWLARKVGVRHLSVTMWLNGETLPTPHKAAAIVRLTNGEVSFADLYQREIERVARKTTEAAA